MAHKNNSNETSAKDATYFPVGGMAFISMIGLGLLQGGCSQEKNRTAGTTPDPTVAPAYGTPVAEYGIMSANITYQLGGKIYDARSQPVKDVTVSFLDNKATTDADGVWSINAQGDDCNATQECMVLITPPSTSSYATEAKQLADSDVSAAKFVSLGNVFKLQDANAAVPLYGARPTEALVSYQISGTVVDDSTGTAIKDATVAVVGSTAVTDADGKWTITISAADCTVDQSCVALVSPAAHYAVKAISLKDSDATQGAFVSLNNVIRLAKKEPETVAVYSAPGASTR